MEILLALFRSVLRPQFYGEIRIKIQNGEVVHVEKVESIKLK
jgi:hypothetical protein